MSACLENPLFLSAVDVSLQLAGGTVRTAQGHHEVFTHRPLETQKQTHTYELHQDEPLLDELRFSLTTCGKV